MSIDKFTTYRGAVRALAVSAGTLVFATVHPEGFPTAVYRFDPEKLTLNTDPLPTGGVALLVADDTLWVAGTDHHLYRLPAAGGKAQVFGPEFPAPPVALAALAGDRLGVAVAAQVQILNRTKGKVVQTLEAPETITSLASDPTGQWLAVGTDKGNVCIFESETDATTFQHSDTAQLHEAAVTALLFETGDLRVLSAGADQKLLSTHARGRLEAEDRGRGANHTAPITAMIAGTQERFLTGSSDSTLKSWPLGKGARPVTLKDGMAKVVDLAVVTVLGKPQVVAACADSSLRFFQLDEEGKFGDAALILHGIDGWAKNEMANNDPKVREAALRKLAEFDDLAALKCISGQVKNDSDHVLRLLACRLLTESKHPQARKSLEKAMEHKEEAVRLLAFEGLCKMAGPADLSPLVLALKLEKADLGVRAVQALQQRAGKDEEAMTRLVDTLGSKPAEVRQAALTSLETVFGPTSPEASLTALNSPHADVRRLALVRLFERKLLGSERVQAALRWRGEDPDAEIRRVAFLFSLVPHPALLGVLRQRDAELDRQLSELEGTAPDKKRAKGA